MITVDQLKALATHDPANFARYQAPTWTVMLNPAMETYEITTPLREAAFLATILHETNEFQWLTELGNNDYFSKYDGRADLGNIKPGDGAKFKGRGCIQITGRANYDALSKALNYDFIAYPDAVGTPLYAATSACWWWKTHGCNELADKPDFKAVTRRVNGGLTGMPQRQAYYDKAMSVLMPHTFDNVTAGVKTSP